LNRFKLKFREEAMTYATKYGHLWSYRVSSATGLYTVYLVKAIFLFIFLMHR